MPGDERDAPFSDEHMPLAKEGAELNLAESANTALDLPLDTPDGEVSFDIGSLIATQGPRQLSPSPVHTTRSEQEAPLPPAIADLKDTPTRTFNVISPGLWNPDTPIRFGGKSLQAAVREAAHDDDRRQTLRERLGMEKQQLEATQSETTDDRFIPLDTEEQQQGDDGLPTDGPVHISSPGPSHQADLSQTVKQDDYVR